MVKKNVKAAPKAKLIAAKKKAIRSVPIFRRPHTLRTKAVPKPPKSTRVVSKGLDNYKILKYPYTTEHAMKKIEENNTLVFIVDLKARKPQIKK
eukprot:gene18747-103_t